MTLFKKLIKSKALYLVASLIFQFLVLLILLTYFSHEFLPIYYLMVGLSVIVCVGVINRDSDTSSKILWVFVIMALPFFGGMMYLLFGGRKIPKALKIQDRQAYADYNLYFNERNRKLKQEDYEDPVLEKMSNMAWNNGKFSLYKNSSTRYFKTGEDQYKAIVEALKKAEHFIFIETYILDNGEMLDTILGILEEKAAQGLDVRLIYDDFGSLLNIDHDFPERMREKGIQCYAFNPIKPQLAIQMNNRDHRKIIVVDGRTAFTGGSNIADEYINKKERFGYWKDMGMQLTGSAVEMFTISFIQLWNFCAPVNTPYEKFVLPPSVFADDRSEGYVIPFSDSPTDENNTGKNMHLNMLATARKFCWISTPYLILDAEMESALILAVNNGVDVRLVVPGIPDKKTVYQVTKANYDHLLRKGVRIYEYSPGFIHGKVTLADDVQALVGTVNMDFRSYYYNYECGIWGYKTEMIPAIHQDFEQIFADSREITLDDVQMVNPLLRYYRNFLKIFSPLM